MTDGTITTTLAFGLDPQATDSIDRNLGESELPPLPPQEVFDARFVGFDIQMPLGLGTLKDYRQGDSSSRGERVHELMYQAAVGRTVTIVWDLPRGITALLQDIYQGTLIRAAMSDTGRYTVQNPSIFNRLKMTVHYETPSSVGQGEPNTFTLCQNYPNPFNPRTTIRFVLPQASQTRLVVYTISGQHVASLVDAVLGSGRHDVTFESSNLASGSYFYRIESGGGLLQRKMTFLK